MNQSKLIYLRECTSVLDEARSLLRSRNFTREIHGTTIHAGTQTNGRGRQGRTWTDAPGKSILAVYLCCDTQISEPDSVQKRNLLPLITALAIANALKALRLEPRIKYPNDVLIGPRKIAGILIESITSPAHRFTLIGFGINVHQTLEELPTDARTPPTSIFLETGLLPAITPLLQSLIDELEQVLEQPLSIIHEHLIQSDGTRGRHVQIEFADNSIINGLVRNITEDGQIQLETHSGIRSMTSGEIHHLTILEDEPVI